LDNVAVNRLTVDIRQPLDWRYRQIESSHLQDPLLTTQVQTKLEAPFLDQGGVK
jgi:hypothetical protein